MGDWIAQWDTKYRAWFYYNVNTEESTWFKPKELSHVIFKNPATKREPKYNTIPTDRYGRPSKQPYSANDANRRIIVESDQDEFFGLNTETFKNEGFLAGLNAKMNDFYENTAKDYISDVYSDALEDYLGGTVQLVGWFLFGSMAVLFNDFMSNFKSSRSFGAPTLTEFFTGRGMMDDNGNVELPFARDLLGLELKFPIDDTLVGCYKDRETCVNKDLPSELDLLISNVMQFKDFFWKWFSLSETISDMVGDMGEGIDDDLTEE